MVPTARIGERPANDDALLVPYAGDLVLRIANDIGARKPRGVLGPAVTPGPQVHRVQAAIKTVAVVGFDERPRRVRPATRDQYAPALR